MDEELGIRETDHRMTGNSGLYKGDAPMHGKCANLMINNTRTVKIN